MKYYISLLALCGTLHTASAQTLTKDEVASASLLLVRLTDGALKSGQLDKVVIYYNTFKLMEPQEFVPDKYKTYFQTLVKQNAAGLCNWVVMYNGSKPKVAGGFTNLETEHKFNPVIPEIPAADQ